MSEQRDTQRRRAVAILVGVVLIALIAAGVAAVELRHSPRNNPSGNRAPVKFTVANAVTNVSTNTLSAVAGGKVVSLPIRLIGQPPLVAAGKPEMLYIGAEFCPFCAVERWSMAIALSKFGTLSHLGQVRSAIDEGNFASLDFRHSRYTSKYLTFVPIENEDRNRRPLQRLTAAQKALWLKLTDNRPGFPFIDFGNKLAYLTTVPLDPSALGTFDQTQIARQLNNPASKVARTIDGGANDDIAAICTMTGNQPGVVCDTPAIKDIQAAINS